jgi:hypothetical protein
LNCWSQPEFWLRRSRRTLWRFWERSRQVGHLLQFKSMTIANVLSVLTSCNLQILHNMIDFLGWLPRRKEFSLRHQISVSIALFLFIFWWLFVCGWLNFQFHIILSYTDSTPLLGIVWSLVYIFNFVVITNRLIISCHIKSMEIYEIRYWPIPWKACKLCFNLYVSHKSMTLMLLLSDHMFC